MSIDAGENKSNRLAIYGEPVSAYNGEGVLKPDGSQGMDCLFEASQLTDGTILLLCDFVAHNAEMFSLLHNLPWDRFVGKTGEGHAVRTDGKLFLISIVGSSSRGITAIFRLQRLHVSICALDKIQGMRFYITNFVFVGTEAVISHGASSDLRLPLRLQHTNENVRATIAPLPDYKDRVKRLQVTKRIDLTCVLDLDLSPDNEIEDQEALVAHVCYILSIARGTPVQWIYYEQYGEGNQIASRTHHLRVTKPYGPLQIIDSKDGEATKQFIEGAYSVYMEKRGAYKLDQGVLDAYLDAKAETDYLQMRGVKLVVAVEMLKSVFLELPDAPVMEYIIDRKQFAKYASDIRRAIRSVLEQHNVDAATRDACTSKVPELNRTSFKEVLMKLCDTIDLKYTDKGLKSFVNCRNSLVHTGDFHINTNPPKQDEEDKLISTPVGEFFFLLNFLDRVYLRLLGYSGPYIDWTVPENPVRQAQV